MSKDYSSIIDIDLNAAINTFVASSVGTKQNNKSVRSVSNYQSQEINSNTQQWEKIKNAAECLEERYRLKATLVEEAESKMDKLLSYDKIKLIRALLSNGIPYSTIAKIVGINTKSVENYITSQIL